LVIDLYFGLHRVSQKGGVTVVDQVLVLEHVTRRFTFEVN
jgi:hypothetical protein